VAEEHFMDERYWSFDGTAQPAISDHPYWCTFDTTSKRKMASPAALIVSGMNLTGGVMRVTVFLRALFLFP